MIYKIFLISKCSPNTWLILQYLRLPIEHMLITMFANSSHKQLIRWINPAPDRSTVQHKYAPAVISSLDIIDHFIIVDISRMALFCGVVNRSTRPSSAIWNEGLHHKTLWALPHNITTLELKLERTRCCN